MFLVDSGQFGVADFKSNVCQIVNIEHFFSMAKKFKMATRKYGFLLKASKLLHFDPSVCIEHEYKLSYCGHYAEMRVAYKCEVKVYIG